MRQCVDVPKKSIDRAHRIGRVRDDGKQEIIVRFKSFQERTLVVQEQEKMQESYNVSGSYDARISTSVLGQGSYQKQAGN